MKTRALATDYDGTLAREGRASPASVQALQRFKKSGRRILLVTGREMLDLRTVFPHIDIFDAIVAENGAVLHWPANKTSETLAGRPDPGFIAKLRERHVAPLSVGEVIVATLDNNRRVVEELIDELGLNLHVIMNKGSMMILPLRVDKALGLNAALARLGISAAEVAGIGDAENDFPFLRVCGYSAAVANALPFLKTQVSWVTPSGHGAGVEELVDQLLAWDHAWASGQ